jgi:hypothetical protein
VREAIAGTLKPSSSSSPVGCGVTWEQAWGRMGAAAREGWTARARHWSGGARMASRLECPFGRPESKHHRFNLTVSPGILSFRFCLFIFFSDLC